MNTLIMKDKTDKPGSSVMVRLSGRINDCSDNKRTEECSGDT